MAITVLTIADVALLFVAAARIFSSRDFVKTAVLAVSSFCFLYVIAGGLLFMFDAFRFERALAGVLVCAAVCAACCVVRARRRGGLRKGFVGWGFEPVPVFLAMLSLLLTFGKFELYHQGQDQGSYQARAIELYAGNYGTEHDFEEYHLLESEEDRQAYRDLIEEAFEGYYPISAGTDPVSRGMQPKSDISGMYQGVQTFPAIIALAGRLFGLKNMMQVQTVFFVCSVLLTYYALRNMGLGWAKALGALSVFALSPLAIWVSKAALTEGILTLCISFYLFLLTQGDTPAKRLLLAFPLAAFGFIHISYMILYPAFVLVYLILFLQSGQKEYLSANAIGAVCFSLGYTVIARIAPGYLFNHFTELYVGRIVTQDNIFVWIYAAALLVALLPPLLLRVRNRQALYEKLMKLRKIVPLLVLLCGALAVYRMAKTALSGSYESKAEWVEGIKLAIGKNAFVAYAMVTGFAVFALILACMVFWNKDPLWSSAKKTAIWVLFIHCVLLQSALLRTSIIYYYYFARYLAFYLPLFAMVMGMLLCELPSWIPWMAVGLSCAVMAVFDAPLLTQKDLTPVEWETVTDICEAVQEDSAVIMTSFTALHLLPETRALAHSAVFPALDDMEREVAMLKERYSNVYFLHRTVFHPDMPDDMPDYIVQKAPKLIYRDGSHCLNGTIFRYSLPRAFVRYECLNELFEL